MQLLFDVLLYEYAGMLNRGTKSREAGYIYFLRGAIGSLWFLSLTRSVTALKLARDNLFCPSLDEPAVLFSTANTQQYLVQFADRPS